MSEYIYHSNGEPLSNERGEIYLALAGEIVRCRDCKYFMVGHNTDRCAFTDKYARADGFCAWAERKECVWTNGY